MENLLKYLFPPKCVFCGSEGEIFCGTCLAECSLLPTQYCLLCDLPSESGYTHKHCAEKAKVPVPSRLLCVYSYSGKVRDCIKFSKYGAKQFLSLRQLCREAAGVYDEMWGVPTTDLCLPIPSSPKKLASRGFNQANMIAEEFSKKFHLSLNKNLLIRVRNTEAQHTQDREGRRENVRGSFAVTNPSEIKEKKILLVDDVVTTGATLQAAKAELERFQTKNIKALCLFRAR